MSHARYVFAGGGTGGHLFPGLAVAHALKRQDPDATIHFFTTNRPLDRDLLERTSFAQIAQPVRPFTLNPLRFPGFCWSWRSSVSAARARLKELRPRAVLGLGGYAAGPPVVAARSLGIRTAILNPDAIPGRANRYLAKRCDLIVCQWEASIQHFDVGTNCQTLGCPIRAEFSAATRAGGRERFGLDPEKPTLLVTGASQGARTLNRVMQQVWPEFLTMRPEWQLLHLSGPLDEVETRAAYDQAGVTANVIAFTHEMWLALAAADLVVSRAGASTLAELTALGLPSILLPYPYHRDQHQHANAQVLVDAGAALLIEDRLDPALNFPAVLDALRRVSDPARRTKMAEAARSLGRPDAADRVAAWMAG